MRRFSYLASLVGLLVIGVPLGVHLLPSESALTNQPSITAASSLGKPETCLRLGFASRSGLYLSNVRVAIRDRDGDSVTHVLYWDLNIVPIELLVQGYGLQTV